MKFTLRYKIILSNIIIILLALTIIATIVIQGMLYYNIQYSEKRLIQNSDNANLFIQQYILSQDGEHLNSRLKIFKENSTYLAEELSKQNNIRIQLFDQSKNLLADSTTIDIESPTEEREEINIAISRGEKAYVVKDLDEGRYIYFASPIIMENQQLGVLSYIYSLEDVDELINQSIILFLIAGFLGLITMYFVSVYLTRKILTPVYELIDSSEEIANGNFQHQIAYVSHDEIGELTRSFNKMVINIREKINEIRSEKKKLQSVLSSIQDGVLAIDNDKNLLTINEPALEIFQIKQEDTIISSIFSYPFIEELYQEVKQQQQGITKEISIDNRYLLIYANIIHHTYSKPIGYIFVIRDITQIRELEEKQRQFISSVSHELRTPLTTIIGYSDMLMRRGVENPELVKKSISLIKKEGDRLLRLVNDLLDLSRLENMEFDLIKSQIDLLQLLDDVITQMRVKGKKYQNDIHFNFSPLPKINGDYDRLKQVFINIIDNAIKYSEPDNPIEIYTSQNGNYVEVSIRDFGSGMSKEELGKIFEPFYRIDKVRSRNLGGSGLGLAIVKELVEKHGGTIEMESEIDEGTLVTIKLPIE
ncbi:ATP-binding protein [Garciella nitratireducens]|uniref:histidine kinase n=1 Tax=Garciella nitratireducens DSM 15102 TaxID=1121911 RepID=A0A1T4NS37_9FIRM|nr:ATP-binding protein [Garciella nitratireducens]RBP44752.1 PAS/PAC sensor signal transduction histidine kinase [Garciella nitratireducens]SJZ82099.1 two-component system, OmpR family, sensor histidine kinase VicK [Garciella nitratireducens DSM 15102]